MAWVLLFCAGVLEVAWAYFLKRSAGFTVLAPSLLTVMTMIASFWLLALSMRTLPLGTAYAVWTGIGALGTFLIGIAVLGEAATPMRFLAAALILAGLGMMYLSGSH